MSIPTRRLVIATRESRLALWQAQHVRALLEKLHPGLVVELLPMTTRGDQILDRSLARVGGKGLFVKELEIAMAEGRADLAVHSCKDVPMELPSGFTLAAILEREDPRDAFVSNHYGSLSELPAGAIVGTSSLRREAQLRIRFPTIEIRALRGNLDTRLLKLDRGEYHGMVLALAGLRRLDLESRVREVIEPEASLPAAGQGALAIECRGDRPEVLALVQGLDDRSTAICVRAERAVSRALGGSCQVPLAAHARLADGELQLDALVASPDGRTVARASGRARADEADTVSEGVVRELRRRGADDILSALRAS